jgi:hypothetical protein
MSKPDFTSVHIEHKKYPWSSAPRIEATFDDPVLTGYKVIMVADTVPTNSTVSSELSPERMSTMICRFPRVILPEVNTHRVFSRNSASSRARSFKTTIRSIMEEPYIPLWTVNQKGMGGQFADDDVAGEATDIALDSRDEAVMTALRFMLGDLLPDDADISDWEHWVDYYNTHVYKAEHPIHGALSIHKQNANRVLEPWMWHEALISSTYWSNFLHLRIDDAAMPEIHALAVLVKAVLEESAPDAAWLHLPFVSALPDRRSSWDELMPVLMSSASECARISYKDRSTATSSDNTVLGERLLAQEHLSPFEHVAFAYDDLSDEVFTKVYGETKLQALESSTLLNTDYKLMHHAATDSNLSDAWVQLRPILTHAV